MIFRKNKEIDSKYDANEDFSFDEAPQTFKSVTEKSINLTRYNCVKAINDFDQNQIQANLETVNGKFGHLYKKLLGDYGTRKNKLRKAYSEGLADIEAEISDFPLMVEEHNKLFEEYSDAYEAIFGKPLDESCKYSTEKLQSFEERIKVLNSRKGE